MKSDTLERVVPARSEALTLGRFEWTVLWLADSFSAADSKVEAVWNPNQISTGWQVCEGIIKTHRSVHRGRAERSGSAS